MTGRGFNSGNLLIAAIRSMASLLCIAALAAAGEGPFEDMSPVVPAAPTLRVDTAIYNLDQGVLQYAFTFANPSDSVLYLDCQVPPRATLTGNTLVLDFDRTAAPPAPGAADSAGAAAGSGASGPSAGKTAGGPTAGGAVDPNDFPPQRIGAQQTFQGQRRLDRVLGDFHARPKFTNLQLRMAFYPERVSGEGVPFVAEKQRRATSKTITVVRRGKAPPPPRVLKFKTH
ncbi:MAG: hypothetical protein JWO30_1319 [Fibrobacteres bacterium]|nr:hypothetical protein [Fibrobacterota bacterium]